MADWPIVSSDQNVFAMLDAVTSTGPVAAQSFYSNDGVAMLLLPAANMVVASRHDMTKTNEACMRSIIEKINTPLWKEQLPTVPEEELLSNRAGPIDRYRYLFVRIFHACIRDVPQSSASA